MQSKINDSAGTVRWEEEQQAQRTGDTELSTPIWDGQDNYKATANSQSCSLIYKI